MRLGRAASLATLVAVVVVAGFLLLQLVRKADRAHLSRRDGPPSATAAPGAATVVWRQTVQFDHGGSFASLLRQGWSTPEPGSGVWSFGTRARLQIPAPPVTGAMNVTLAVTPFVVATRPFQRVRVRAGTRILGEWRLTNSGPASLSFQAPADLRGPAGELELQIDLPDAAAPMNHVKDAMDPRPLAIKLHHIEVFG